MEGPIRVKELGDMTPEIPPVQISLKPDILSSEAVFGDLIFVSKESNEYKSWR
jgi:hypothetical protein